MKLTVTGIRKRSRGKRQNITMHGTRWCERINNILSYGNRLYNNVDDIAVLLQQGNLLTGVISQLIRKVSPV